MSKILIVDDEVHIRLLLEQTLEDFEEAGVEILTCDNGKKAVDLIVKEKPALVFVDIMMPEMDGINVCHKIKKGHGLKDIFIIMLTAKGQDFDQKKGLAAGADLFMTKPFDPDVIVKKTAEILKISL